jgi:hypothetical protein
MRPIIWFLSLFILLIFQAGVLAPLHLAPISLILIMIVAAALLADFNSGLGLTLIGGLLLDFSSGVPDGLVTMSLLCVFLLLYFIVNSVLAREPSQIILFSSVASATIAYFVIFLSLNQIFSLVHLTTNLGVKYVLTVELPLSLLFNLIFTYPIFQYYLWVQKLINKFIKYGQPIRNQ